jgi:hypothetical protein
VNDPGRAAGRWLVAPLTLLAFMLLLLGCGGAEDGQQTQAAPTETTGFVLPVKNETCLTCHADLEQRMADEDRKVFSHDQHLKQRLKCETCHTPMGHTGSPVPDRQICDDCHGMPMPHPDDYETAHGEDTVVLGDEVCARCHNVYLHCQFCHGVQMPHPDQWELKHGEVAWPEMQTCERCHDQEYCLTCHPVEMPHPLEWTKTHGGEVQLQGSAMCNDCHEPQLCVACHGVEMPHPQDWGVNHPQVTEKKRGECMLCHDESDCTTCHEIHRTHGKGGES